MPEPSKAVGEAGPGAPAPSPPLLGVDVIRPVPAASGDGSMPVRPTPFHPAASALLVIVDNLWSLEEFLIVDWIVTVPLSFLTVFGPTYGIQRHLARDGRPAALWKALFFGVVAAVPFSVTGTPVGVALLAWAGVRRWKG